MKVIKNESNIRREYENFQDDMKRKKHSCQLFKICSSEIWSYLVATSGTNMRKENFGGFEEVRLTKHAFADTLIGS